jgi:hypothetical protein
LKKTITTDDARPQIALSSLSERMSADQYRQYDLLSPGEFQAAAEYLSEAQDRLEQAEPAERVLEDANEASLRLQIGERNAAVHLSAFQAVMNARQKAIAIHASQSADFVSADQELRSLGQQIEQESFHLDPVVLSALESRYSNIIEKNKFTQFSSIDLQVQTSNEAVHLATHLAEESL